jgi:putative flippase GtrA
MEAILARLSPRARRLVTGIGWQFFKFGVVGTLGFVVDTATVYATRGWLGIYGAGLVAYLFGATFTWAANRSWTFRGHGGGPIGRQWLRFLGVNLIGFTANRGTFFTLVATVPFCFAHPVVAVAAGAIAGMFLNFGFSRAWVFTPTTP